MTDITMDFVTDWQNEMIKEMEEEGLRFKKSLPKDSLLIKYFTYCRKRGLQKPYNIFKSNEFNCPEEYQKGLSNLEEILKSGGDISPYLSKDVEKLKNDLMFNDWGVLHLHLGEKLESNNKYIERTGPLLFLYFKGENVYFINIFQHQDWTKKEVLQIMYSNWPELIQPYIMKIDGFQGLHPEYTEDDHLKLRKAGITVMLELVNENGEKFPIIPTGMGITASGDSMNDVRHYQHQIKEIRSLEDMVRSNIDFVKQTMKSLNVNIPTSLSFKLVYKDGRFQVQEENTGLFFDLK
ncbi:hypothetical protein [Robertmurraya sp. FSL R5-0851]|uniref:hypothetical protein n=1 Tax=Robertmurraya sp. FSL R5-0851 TaxID=2921584 RepID=UPI0030F969C2